MSDLYSKILAKIVHFIAYRARTEYEIDTKLNQVLYKLKVPENEAETLKRSIKAELHELNLINDLKFSIDFIEAKLRRNKPYGLKRIRPQLKQKGVSDSDIESAMSTLNTQDINTSLIKLYEKKVKELKNPSDFKSKQKIINYLISRGFDPSGVYSLVDSKFKVK